MRKGKVWKQGDTGQSVGEEGLKKKWLQRGEG